MEALPHPYYPLNLKVVGYVPNEWTSLTLVSIFASACAITFLAVYTLTMKVHPKVSRSDLWTIMWFVLSGSIHLILEGYYVYNFRSMSNKQDILGQLWKEYSLSDSRYQSENAFVLCMETITSVCWGPLCFACAFFIMTSHPLRHPVQAIVSLGQLYGDVIYYGTSLFDHYILGLSYSRPEPLIFWGYFVFCNTFWIVIPFVLILSSLSESKRAFVALGRDEGVERGRKSQ
ncbi:EBDP4 emopamil-binding protein [Penicillium argentinense]|uniref:EBDP4 emopamil-binding protein n=1 Tax=Penicillium argentinense TaxID=1131581 RepID=A0A9W9F857_9EURO|nr:EBDP4 emopamil-binding protein [Penicillium argentinense]KAJ5095242.1 EBDP4 emopamil-binding protein [Penicillium argentinense]